MENIIVEKVALKDVNQLQKVSKQTFLEAFSVGNSQVNMAKYIEEAFSLEKLTAELNNEQSAFYFALLDENVIGYLKLNFGESQTELKEDKGLEVERIYVLQEFLGKKVGQVLYEKAMEIADQINAEFVWLGVWEENTRAISFYKKNGFEEFDKHIFWLGDDEQTDIMMKKELGAGS
ncbi:GNAT family N-acetyltransferase [Pedobacter immunditicola]|uniref:GNAT family N-acetyltransferase n=1 Tax=Pedobacter immunditicola TaxID=3133440 RepID=UPI0030A6D03A